MASFETIAPEIRLRVFKCLFAGAKVRLLPNEPPDSEGPSYATWDGRILPDIETNFDIEVIFINKKLYAEARSALASSMRLTIQHYKASWVNPAVKATSILASKSSSLRDRDRIDHSTSVDSKTCVSSPSTMTDVLVTA